MNTCGIKIGKDCQDIIMNYVYQLETTSKFDKVLKELKSTYKYEIITEDDGWVMSRMFNVKKFYDISFRLNQDILIGDVHEGIFQNTKHIFIIHNLLTITYIRFDVIL